MYFRIDGTSHRLNWEGSEFEVEYGYDHVMDSESRLYSVMDSSVMGYRAFVRIDGIWLVTDGRE
jgi:hypothetical protein